MAHFLCHLGCSHFGALLLDFYFTENRHLGFKYKKSDKTLTRHSKNFTYMIAFSSFGGNTKDNIGIEVCYIINTRPYDPYGYAKPDINTQPLFYSLRDNEIYLCLLYTSPSPRD